MPKDTQRTVLFRQLIGEALVAARTTRIRLVVGMKEDGDGPGDFGYLPEARAPLSFTPAWLVTPEGDVVACRPARTN